MNSIAITKKLERAGRNYQTCRKRQAIYQFLMEVYSIYCFVKDSTTKAKIKTALRRHVRQKTTKSKTLSALLFSVASADFDRRDVHKWKRVIEIAYEEGITPRGLSEFVKKKGGINAIVAGPALPNALLQVDQASVPSLLSRISQEPSSVKISLKPAPNLPPVASMRDAKRRSIAVGMGSSSWTRK